MIFKCFSSFSLVKIHNTVKTSTTASALPPPDDGTRLVRIVGCEYRLSESEIMGWLVCFGEVLSEITEERFETGDLDPDLPPIGNGTYVVRMKLVKDLPNWVPMFGKKICLDYRGIRRQCNNCYGPHVKKYCRSERVGMENFVKGFSKRYPFVPEELYGRLAQKAAKPVPETSPTTSSKNVLESGSGSSTLPVSGSGSGTGSGSLPKGKIPTNCVANVETNETRPKILITLKRNNGTTWSPSEQVNQDKQVVAPARENTANTVAASVAGNVSSFLSGIRATFRQENVYVSSGVRPREGTLKASNYGKLN